MPKLKVKRPRKTFKRRIREYQMYLERSYVPKLPLRVRWYSFWHTPLKEHLANMWAWLKPYLTWKMAPFMLIAWCLIDGWPWALGIIGIAYNISWMKWVAGIAESILWQPWMAEKFFIVIPLGIFLYQFFFHETIDEKKLLTK